MGHRKRKCTSLQGHFTNSDCHIYLSLKRIPLSTHGPSKFPWGKDYFWFDTASFCRVPPCCTWCTSDSHSPRTWMLQRVCYVQVTKGGMNLHMQLFSWRHHALIQNNKTISESPAFCIHQTALNIPHYGYSATKIWVVLPSLCPVLINVMH